MKYKLIAGVVLILVLVAAYLATEGASSSNNSTAPADNSGIILH